MYIAQIEEGKLKLDVGAVDVPQMVASVARQFEATLEAKRISLEVLVDPLVPQVLIADSMRLRQVHALTSSNSLFDHVLSYSNKTRPRC